MNLKKEREREKMIREIKERRGCWHTEWEKKSLSEEQSEEKRRKVHKKRNL